MTDPAPQSQTERNLEKRRQQRQNRPSEEERRLRNKRRIPLPEAYHE